MISFPLLFVNESQLVDVKDLNTNVKICILDTGINKSHLALPEIKSEIDLVNKDDDATDDNGHGTHVAGIISSKDPRYPGIAPNAFLYIAKVLDEEANGREDLIVSAIEWCKRNNVDIISISIGGSEFNENCDENIIAMKSNEAVDQGITVVAATGTRGTENAIMTPGCASKVISVGGVDSNDQIGQYSNTGSEIDLVAPGTDIISTDLDGEFSPKTGTSAAVPYISGTIALMLESDPTLTPLEIKKILEEAATDLGEKGWDPIYGYGKVNTDDALKQVQLHKMQ